MASETHKIAASRAVFTISGFKLNQGVICSCSVVGYDTVSLLANGGAKGVGASFVTVSGKGMKLSDLSVTGYDPEEGYADFEVYAQELSAGGTTLATYSWCDFEEDGEVYKGWYDGDMNCFNDVDLVPGEGLWVYSPSTDFKIVSAGAVPDADISVMLRANGGAKMVVNPMPVTLTLGQIKVAGYDPEEGYADFEVYAQELSAGGTTLATYSWCDFEEDGEVYYGWYDGDMNEFNNVTLEAGEGLWVYSPSTDFSIVFPSPLVK